MRKHLLPGLLALSGVLSCSDFSSNQERYQQVIQDVRARIEPGPKSLYFRTTWDFGPTLPDDTNVCARLTPAGQLFVRITARDNHHAGRYGYAFADPPMETGRQVSLALEENGCGEWETIKPIDDHWWELESHLD